jgi:hypothetical protein
MEKETIKNIFEFLEDNEGKRSVLWKLINNEPLTEDDLHIKGDLDLTNTDIKSLPDGLKVAGHLYLYESKIESLPEGLKVGGALYLQGTNIASLPEGLKVTGLLDLNGCTSLTSLPEGLEVRGIWLDLENTSITSLPKGLKVYQELYIADTKLKEYTDEELREMVKPGFIKGRIYR